MENEVEYRVGNLNAFLAIMSEALGRATLAALLKLDLCRFLQVVRQMLRVNADIVT